MSHESIDCRCKFQCSLPQYETQRILEAHLASLGGVVERGVTATKVETDADGVVVELVHADGGTETVRPSIVIGAGGAHSVTRHSMSKPLEGATYRGHFLVADIAMPAPFPRDEAGVICCPDGLLLLAPLPGGRWISFQDLEEDVESVPAENVVARVAGTARREISAHRRLLVHAVPDAPAHRVAPGGRPAVPDRRRRPPVEPVRRRRAQRGPARRLRPGLEAGAHPARPRASVAARPLHGRAPYRRPPRARRLRPGAHVDRRRCGCGAAGPRGPSRGRGPDRRRAAAQRARHDRRRLRGEPARRRPRKRRGRQRGTASRAALSGLGALRWTVTPRARLRTRRGLRVARTPGPALVRARADRSRAGRRSRFVPASRPAAWS